MTLFRTGAAVALLALLAGCAGAPTTDHPIVAGGAVAPNAVTATGAPVVAVGYQCYAGAYVCNLPAPGPVGTGCSCPGLGAPSYGTIR